MQTNTTKIYNLIQKTTKNHFVKNEHKSLLLPLSFQNLIQNVNAFNRQPVKSAPLNNIGVKINSLQALSEFKKVNAKETSIASLDLQKLQTLKTLQKIIKFASEQTISSSKPFKIILKSDPSENINIKFDPQQKLLKIQVDTETLKKLQSFLKEVHESAGQAGKLQPGKVSVKNLDTIGQFQNPRQDKSNSKSVPVISKNKQLAQDLNKADSPDISAPGKPANETKINAGDTNNQSAHKGGDATAESSTTKAAINSRSKETTKKAPAILKNTQMAQEMTKADVLDKSAQDKSANKTIFRMEYPTKQPAQRGEDANAKALAPKASINSKPAVIESTEKHSENNSGIPTAKTSKFHQDGKLHQSLSRTEAGKIEAQKTATSESQPFTHKTSQTSQQNQVNKAQELLNHIIFESNEKNPVSQKNSKSLPEFTKIKLRKKATQEQSTEKSKIIVGKYRNQSAQKVNHSNIDTRGIKKSNKLTIIPEDNIDKPAENENAVSIEEQSAEQNTSKTPQKLTKNAGLINPGKVFIRHDSANNLQPDSVKSINESLHASKRENPNNGEHFHKSKYGKSSNKPLIDALNKAIQDKEQAPALSSTKHNSSDEDKPDAQNDIETLPDFGEENIHKNENQMRFSTNPTLVEGLSENIKSTHAVNFDSTLSFNKVSTLLGNKTTGAPLVQRSVLPEMLQKIMENANARLTMSGQKLEILLDVESLGKLAIDAVKQQEKIHLHINVENNEARQWLENHVRPLIEQINKAGIEVEKFEVSVGNPKLEQQQREKEDPAMPGFRNKENISRTRESRNDILNDEKIPPYMLKRNFGYNTVEVWI